MRTGVSPGRFPQTKSRLPALTRSEVFLVCAAHLATETSGGEVLRAWRREVAAHPEVTLGEYCRRLIAQRQQADKEGGADDL